MHVSNATLADMPPFSTNHWDLKFTAYEAISALMPPTYESWPEECRYHSLAVGWSLCEGGTHVVLLFVTLIWFYLGCILLVITVKQNHLPRSEYNVLYELLTVDDQAKLERIDAVAETYEGLDRLLHPGAEKECPEYQRRCRERTRIRHREILIILGQALEIAVFLPFGLFVPKLLYTGVPT